MSHKHAERVTPCLSSLTSSMVAAAVILSACSGSDSSSNPPVTISGQVVGSYSIYGTPAHGFLYSGGTYITLDDPLDRQEQGRSGEKWRKALRPPASLPTKRQQLARKGGDID